MIPRVQKSCISYPAGLGIFLFFFFSFVSSPSNNGQTALKITLNQILQRRNS
jgi:hypothetical protein